MYPYQNAHALTARQVFEVLATGDPRLAQQVAHPEFRNREAAVAPSAASNPGPGGLLASSAWMRHAFSNLHFTIIDSAENHDFVWLRLRMTGVQTGAFVQYTGGELAQAVPPTGRTIDVEQIHVLEMRDGLVIGHEAVRDDVTMLGQLGVFPPSLAAGLRMLGWSLFGFARREARAVSAEADRAASMIVGRADV